MQPSRPIAFAGLILLAWSTSSNAAGEFPENACGGTYRKPDTIRFHMGGNYPPFEFLADEPLPYTQVGFGVEFARILCDKFELNCEYIRAPYEECWLPTDFPGKGITDGTFDACSTYTDTHLRRWDCFGYGEREFCFFFFLWGV